MRLIDADALKEAMNYNGGCGICFRYVDDADTIDAVPVRHGQWKWLSSTYDRIPCEMRYMCDKCHHETITHGHEPWEKYCPNCGAKMDGDGDAR